MGAEGECCDKVNSFVDTFSVDFFFSWTRKKCLSIVNVIPDCSNLSIKMCTEERIRFKSIFFTQIVNRVVELANAETPDATDPETDLVRHAVEVVPAIDDAVDLDHRVAERMETVHADVSPHCTGTFHHQALSTSLRCNTKRCKRPVKFQRILLPIRHKRPFQS